MTGYCCYLPPGLIPAVELPDAVWDRFCHHAADLALDGDKPVTLVGAAPVGELWIGAYCYHACQFTHLGSTVVIPDLVITELAANGGDMPLTDRLRDPKTGRSVWIYKVMRRVPAP